MSQAPTAGPPGPSSPPPSPPSPASGLVRVTVASGTRRVDLVLPGAVPVAELVPELARSVGLLDATTVYGGYRLVTVDGRELTSDAGRDGDDPAVLDTLDGQAGIAGEPAAVRGEHPVAAVDGGGVEQAHTAGQLGNQLGDRHRSRQHEVHPARSRGNRDPDQTRGAG